MISFLFDLMNSIGSAVFSTLEYLGSLFPSFYSSASSFLFTPWTALLNFFHRDWSATVGWMPFPALGLVLLPVILLFLIVFAVRSAHHKGNR